MLAACCVANAPVLYRLIVDQSHKIASGQSRTSFSRGRGFWFSVNREERRGRAEIDEIEFAGLEETVVEGGRKDFETGWGVDESTMVGSGVGSLGRESREVGGEGEV